jgi:hypothetical protein
MNPNDKQQQSLSNKPIGCTFCGNTIPNARIIESVDYKTKKVVKELRWTCGKCGNVARRGPA